MAPTVWFISMFIIHLMTFAVSASELGLALVDKVMDETPLNVKVTSGQTAILPCTVDPKYAEAFADQYQVIWMNPMETVVSLQDRRVINDMRITVERPFLRDWNIHIRNVSMADSGRYKCQINTDPPRTRKVELIVQEPPSITLYTPLDIKVRVGDHVELFCNASGVPLPTITWYRQNLYGSGKREKVGMVGEILRIRNISRGCADLYECVANNSVPPAKTRSVRVVVQYPPDIRLLNSKISQHLGRETILECIITASPLGVTYWKKDGVEISTSLKYEVDIYNDAPHTVTLSLRIANLEPRDFGEYVCEAMNLLGKSYAKMRLEEIIPDTTTTTTTPRPRRVMVVNNKKNKNLKIYRGKTKTVNGHSQYTPYIQHRTVYSMITPPYNKPSGGAHLTGIFGTGSYSSMASKSFENFDMTSISECLLFYVLVFCLL